MSLGVYVLLSLQHSGHFFSMAQSVFKMNKGKYGEYCATAIRLVFFNNVVLVVTSSGESWHVIESRSQIS